MFHESAMKPDGRELHSRLLESIFCRAAEALGKNRQTPECAGCVRRCSFDIFYLLSALCGITTGSTTLADNGVAGPSLQQQVNRTLI